jgi:hypothetical protein
MIFKKAQNVDSLINLIMREQPFLVQDARDWAKDCNWVETQDDPDNDFIDEIDPIRLLKLVNRHYDGGLKSFVQDSGR